MITETNNNNNNITSFESSSILPPPSSPTATLTKEQLSTSLSTSPTSSNEDLLLSTSSPSSSILPHLPSLQASYVMTEEESIMKTNNNSNSSNLSGESINLLHLASTTLSSTIIASKIIQKHSQFLSHSNTTSSTTTSSPKSKSRIKNDGSIVTAADGESQRLITSYIKSISSSIRIVGEESNEDIQIAQKEYQRNTWWGISPGRKRKLIDKEKTYEMAISDYVRKEVEWRYNKMKTRMMNNVGKQNNHHDNNIMNIEEVNVDPSRVSIYIDPLDGTSSYAKGDYEAVTILAGIMLDNIPIFGIIVKPFGHEGFNIDFCKSLPSSGLDEHDNQSKEQNLSNLGFQRPCCAMYGGTLIGGAYVVSGDEITRNNVHRYHQSTSPSSCTPSNASSSPSSQSPSTFNVTNDNEFSKCKAIISKSRRGGVVQKCIDSLSSKGLLHPEPLFITGAGYKTMRLIFGTFNETMWFFPKPGTSLWDVAPADALLRVMGGRISDKFGNDLDYSKKWTEADNLDGIVACSDIGLHEKCIQLYHDECWDDED